MSIRKVAIVTGTRAEYGLLRPLIVELLGRDNLNVGLFVTGTHLARDFGYTVKEIEDDGFPIWERIDASPSSDTPVSICNSMALTTIGVSKACINHKPDILVGLGDRYELLAAAQAAMIHQIPIAHIHGGEATEGLIDEAIRHSVTKMSHLHFTATETYSRRVIQMGETPDHVFTCGALGLDNILSLDPADRQELANYVGIELQHDKKLFLVTYHPETLSSTSPGTSVRKMLDALRKIDNCNFIITYPNADMYGREVLSELRKFVNERTASSALVESLGVRRYLSAMKIADLVVGNSSSGLIEAPSFGIPTVNVGDRQAGRICATSVISCNEDTDAISTALELASTNKFKSIAKQSVNPYGDGNAAGRIAEQISEFPLEGILHKSFNDGVKS